VGIKSQVTCSSSFYHLSLIGRKYL